MRRRIFGKDNANLSLGESSLPVVVQVHKQLTNRISKV